MNRTTTSGLAVLIVGLLVFAMTCATWLFAAINGIDPGPLFYIAGPVIGSLFLAPTLSKAADAATQAAAQTNGALDGRVEAAVAAALARRDAARTRQAAGDVGLLPPAPDTGGH